jgi:hypothetical protein
MARNKASKLVSKVCASVGKTVDRATDAVGAGAKKAASKTGDAIEDVHGPSPNPMTNLVIADVALRGGGQLLRHAVERTLLGAKYNPEKAKAIVKGRSMTQTLVGTALARVATRSVPGMILVGGGLLAKTLYDRSKSRSAAKAEGEQALAEQVADGRKKD